MWKRLKHWFGEHDFEPRGEAGVADLVIRRLDGSILRQEGLVQEYVCCICGKRDARVVKYLDGPDWDGTEFFGEEETDDGQQENME
jgi:hypothetical protein